MDTKLSNIKQWFNSSRSLWVKNIFICSLIILAFLYVDRNMRSKPETTQPSESQISEEREYFKRVEQLDKQIADQNLIIEQHAKNLQQYQINLETLTAANKILEKRLQAHVEVMKRICEYIGVITVDKKIVPRQCLHDYSWRKEEN